MPSNESKRRLNAYYCEKCRGYVVTEDVDEGVTPMFLACRVKGDPSDPANNCKGTSRSLMYPEQPWPERDGYGQRIPTRPTWEWYRPTSADFRAFALVMTSERLASLQDHVDRGGLDIRRKESVPDA